LNEPVNFKVAPAQACRKPETDHEPVRLADLEDGLDLLVGQRLRRLLVDLRQHAPREGRSLDPARLGAPVLPIFRPN
jgi:hypothetical protein